MPVPGLPVSQLVSVSVQITPTGASFLNINTLLILGDSNVIDTFQRIRTYGSIDDVAADFSNSSPEYLAANLYFQQSPTPQQLYIGRWAQANTSGLLFGGILTAAQQAMSNWTSITNGGFHITVDGGSSINVTGINLSGASNLNGVASLINSAMTSASVPATCSYNVNSNGAYFSFTSNSSGSSSQVSALTPPSSGVDLSAPLRANVATLSYRVAGVTAETALQAVEALDGTATTWYGLMVASTHVTPSDHQAISAFIESDGSNNPHLYGVSTQDTAALLSTDTTSIGYLLFATEPNRTFPVYSSTTPYAAASLFGRLLTVNPAGNNTTITLMYKQAPGIVPEVLTVSQSAALNAKNMNYYAEFNNNTAIIVNGITSGGQFIDTMWGVDWLQNQIQTDVYNLLYTTLTKIPQTDAGMHLIATTIEQACAAGVENGLLAPGTWNSGGFGQITQGSFLNKGFYVYTPPLANQPEASRARRASVPFQVAAKLAGAVHEVSIAVQVNP